jgi:hypothetical protein
MLSRSPLPLSALKAVVFVTYLAPQPSPTHSRLPWNVGFPQNYKGGGPRDSVSFSLGNCQPFPRVDTRPRSPGLTACYRQIPIPADRP